MSSLKNINKSFQRLHRERHQPENRKHLGYLEKKQDYKARAQDFQRKQNAIKLLRKKALDKNPDEFYFHMINSELRDGRHYETKKMVEFSEAQLKMMQSQDIKYVMHKRNIELNKIERLKSTLHLLDVEGKPKNKHIIFTETAEQARKGDVAKRFDTEPEWLGRTYNVPKFGALKDKKLVSEEDLEQLDVLEKERNKSYGELTKRIEREKQLRILLEKMQMKAEIMKSKGKGTVTKEKEGDANSAPVYKWVKERKR
ncbi:putative U3 small nucleolar RNA-associated protein 11 [Halotydeus destructor]|nr:putative U3 small nucleolar RNA-associated protein 11 [Halotydeus destructor]